jgi:hypothetical protein
MIRAMTVLAHCSHSEGVAFGEDALLVFVLVVFGSLLQELEHYSGTFLFSNSSFWLCASVLPLGHSVVADVGCN